MIHRRIVLSWAILTSAFMASAIPTALASPNPAGTESHCVVDVIDQALDGELLVSEPRCYETFPESVFDTTGGQIALAAGTSGSVVFTDVAARTALAAFALGIHYDGAGGTGSSITVSGSSCTGGHWNAPTAWKNRISSSYNGCARLRHWDLPDKGGAVQDTTGAGTTKNLSTLDNRVESVSYHAS